MKLKKLNEGIYISEQIEITDVSSLHTKGIKTIINNRPDYEIDNQPLSADIAQAAKECGINYYYLPTEPGHYSAQLVKRFSALLTEENSPLVAFCRTGNRCINLWALSQTQKYGRDYVVAKAKSMGYAV